MHRSRLMSILIDCAEEDFDRGVEFWSGALGKAALLEEGGRYVSIRGRVGGDGGPFVVLQRVPAEERAIHLDIESDDVEAEVSRLEKLGATLKARIGRHVVMSAPSGHAFCVVPQSRTDFEGHAAVWQDDA